MIDDIRVPAMRPISRPIPIGSSKPATKSVFIDAAAPATKPKAPLTPQQEKLKKSVDQLQGVFVEQLFKAMRDTVPEQEGIVTGGGGEEIFTGLLDQHLAAETPKHWEGGLSAALYRQLSRGLPSTETPTLEAPKFDPLTPDLPVR